MKDHQEQSVFSPEAPVLVEAKALAKHYVSSSSKGFFKREKKVLHALDGVSLTIREGEFFGVVGESGCGKSTLGRCLLRLIEPTSGSIFFKKEDITRKSRRDLHAVRGQMQMVFQNPYSSFNPKLRIGTSLLQVARLYGMDRQQAEKRIHQLLESISLPEDMLSRSPGELSGGQLQRLAIARALLPDPQLIVADEPVSALDVSVQAQILNLLIDLRKEYHTAMLFISHEMTVVQHLCDTVAVMYLGKVMELAPTQELFSRLLHPYTQALMSAIPKTDPESRAQRIMLEGDIPNAIDLPKGCRFASRCRFCCQRCRLEEPVLRDIGNGHFLACHQPEERLAGRP